MRLSSRCALGLAVALAAALTSPGAQARDVGSARDDVEQIGREVEIAAEEYNEVRVRLGAQQNRVEAAQARVDAQARAIRTMQAEVGALAVETFKHGGVDPQLAALVGGAGDYAVSGRTLTLLAEQRSGSLTELKAAQRELERLRSDTRDELDEVEALEADIGARRSAIDARLAAAEDVLAAAEADAARIEAERRAAAEQATRSRQAAEAAAAAPTGAGAPAVAGTPDPAVTEAESGAAAQVVSAGTVNCGGTAVEAPTDRVATVLTWACGEMGKPYRYGASGPGSYDCSGFTMSAWAQVGVSLPHSSRSQSGYGTPVSRADLRPGDLVFNFSPISHVGIYIGGGRLVAAPSAGDVVKIQSLEYLPFTAGRRL